MIRRAAFFAAVLLAAACALRAAQPDPDTVAAAAEDARVRRTVALADVLAREQQLPEARACYLEALALRPDDLDVAESLLGVVRRQGDWAAQLPLCERLRARRPGDAALAFEAGECLWRLGRAADARRAWGEMLRRFGADAGTCDRLVEFYAAEKLPADARAVLDERRKRFGDNPETRIVEARLALIEGNLAAAVDALLAALDADLDPSDRDRAETLLMDSAALAGRSEEVAKKLAATLDALDAKIPARLMDLARRAADEKDFPAAASLAERALGSLKDPALRADAAAKIALWKAQPPK